MPRNFGTRLCSFSYSTLIDVAEKFKKKVELESQIPANILLMVEKVSEVECIMPYRDMLNPVQ